MAPLIRINGRDGQKNWPRSSEADQTICILFVTFLVLSIFTQIIPSTGAYSAGSAPLELEAKIPLGNVVGRIDHMAIDLAHRRLFVAELGNGSVSVVDLDTQKIIRRIAGFEEP